MEVSNIIPLCGDIFVSICLVISFLWAVQLKSSISKMVGVFWVFFWGGGIIIVLFQNSYRWVNSPWLVSYIVTPDQKFVSQPLNIMIIMFSLGACVFIAFSYIYWCSSKTIISKQINNKGSGIIGGCSGKYNEKSDENIIQVIKGKRNHLDNQDNQRNYENTWITDIYPYQYLSHNQEKGHKKYQLSDIVMVAQCIDGLEDLDEEEEEVDEQGKKGDLWDEERKIFGPLLLEDTNGIEDVLLKAVIKEGNTNVGNLQDIAVYIGSINQTLETEIHGLVERLQGRELSNEEFKLKIDELIKHIDTMRYQKWPLMNKIDITTYNDLGRLFYERSIRWKLLQVEGNEKFPEEWKNLTAPALFKAYRIWRDGALVRAKERNGLKVRQCNKCGKIYEMDQKHECMVDENSRTLVKKGIPMKKLRTIAVTGGKLSKSTEYVVDTELMKKYIKPQSAPHYKTLDGIRKKNIPTLEELGITTILDVGREPTKQQCVREEQPDGPSMEVEMEDTLRESERNQGQVMDILSSNINRLDTHVTTAVCEKKNIEKKTINIPGRMRRFPPYKILENKAPNSTKNVMGENHQPLNFGNSHIPPHTDGCARCAYFRIPYERREGKRAPKLDKECGRCQWYIQRWELAKNSPMLEYNTMPTKSKEPLTEVLLTNAEVVELYTKRMEESKEGSLERNSINKMEENTIMTLTNNQSSENSPNPHC